LVVGDVVAEVLHRRRERRREPDSVDAKRLRPAVEVVEPADEARQVADAVAVRVLERARIDLVEDLPPTPFPSMVHDPMIGSAATPVAAVKATRGCKTGATLAAARRAYRSPRWHWGYRHGTSLRRPPTSGPRARRAPPGCRPTRRPRARAAAGRRPGRVRGRGGARLPTGCL